MAVEELRALVQVPADALHLGHALGQQLQVLLGQADTGFIGLAQPAIERLRQTHAMPGLGHTRTAQQGMAGAIHGFGQNVGRGRSLGTQQVIAHDCDVTVRLARIDVAQRQVGLLLCLWCRTVIDHPVDFLVRA